MTLKNLPIGMSTLSEIINNNYIYIDKTKFVAELATRGKYYFLSRPRRFGKTLFLDTLKQAFLGNKDIFKGLYLEHNWDWSVSYPVIHISFSSGEYKSVEMLNIKINEMFATHCQEHDLVLTNISISGKLDELIFKLYHKYNKTRVVILVDEYDKPVLDSIESTEIAMQMRDGLRELYSSIKANDQYIKLAFLTGVTKFTKAGVFSSLNNLDDITFNYKYADVCGYTQNDIETSFKDYLVGVDLAELKTWYNGYNFLGEDKQKVYNPFDILLFINNDKQYKNYWFETGTPSFLIKLLQKKNYYLPNLEGLQIGNDELASFDINNLSIEVLLLQSGYLTMKSARVSGFNNMMRYTLDYPNFEVRQSLNGAIMSHLFANNIGYVSQNKYKMEDALQSTNFTQMKIILNSLLAEIPHDWFRNNNIGHYEGFYCSVIYTFFNAVGVFAIPEDNTSMGQIDLTLHLSDKIFIVEFKMLNSDNAINALQQIKDKRYHEKYIAQNKPIYLIGMVFDEGKRNICEFAWEEVK